MDGTLLDLHFDNYFWLEHLPKRYAKDNQVSIEEAKQLLDKLFLETKGSLQWYCLDFWTERLGINVSDLKEEVAHLISIRPSALEFLHWLNQNDKNVIMVTNAHRDSLDLKLEKTGIGEHFERIISSHDYQAAKESQDFWRTLNQNLDFQNHDTLLVDDSLAVLDAAKRYGIKHLLTIEQPDSKLPERNITEYSSIKSYTHLMHKKDD